MLDSYINFSTYLFISMGIGIFCILIPLLFVLYFNFKKHLDPIYFNENHFSMYELLIYKSFPLSYIKVLTYIRAIVLPKTMRKRFKDNIFARKDHPVAYTLSFISIIILAYSTIVLVNTFVFSVMYYLYYMR